MNSLIWGPVSVVGVVLGTQSLGSGALGLISALEFSLVFHLASFLLLSAFTPSSSKGARHDRATTTTSAWYFPPLKDVFSLPNFIRSLLLCLCTTFWAIAASRITPHQVLFTEMAIFVFLLPLNKARRILPSELVRILLLGMGFLLLLLLANRMYFALLCFAAVFVRSALRLYRDVQVLLLASACSLVAWLFALLVFSSEHGNGIKLPLAAASALLWVVLPRRSENSASLLYVAVMLAFAMLCGIVLYAFNRSLPMLLSALLVYCLAISTFLTPPQSSGKNALHLLPLSAASASSLDVMVGHKKTPPTTNAIVALWRDLSKDSKKIAMFLTLTLSFMFVELVMGLYTNSLGLISDAGHMFFDSAALLIGLVASVVASKKRPDAYYTYGYDRLELVAGFVNAIFLTFVSVFVLSESLERFTAPPEIKTDGLLLTSVLGLVINAIGLIFFHDHSSAHGHTHAGGGECSTKHGHSHGGGSGGGNNENMQGVFLHVLADALGSVGVIISSLLIQYKQWYIADPICSFMVSLLIFASVLPLLKSTTNSLLLRTPQDLEVKFAALLERAKRKPGVQRIVSAHLWRYSAKTLVCTISLVVGRTNPAAASNDNKEEEVAGEVHVWLVSALRQEIGATDVTVQVCSDIVQHELRA